MISGVISQGSVVLILYDQLAMRMLSANLVTRLLTIPHKRICVTSSNESMALFIRYPEKMMHHFVTVEELCI